MDFDPGPGTYNLVSAGFDDIFISKLDASGAFVWAKRMGANYDDFGQRLDLREDYRAIRWMQENVKGSPVIVEANCPEYHWCTRYTIYTGLPGVVGWNFHQRQQRAFNSTWVEARVAEIGTFYSAMDGNAARDFLKKYDVRYIIVGQLERAAYKSEDFGNGLSKFEEFDGMYWDEVYRDGNTVIYEVKS